MCVRDTNVYDTNVCVCVSVQSSVDQEKEFVEAGHFQIRIATSWKKRKKEEGIIYLFIELNSAPYGRLANPTGVTHTFYTVLLSKTQPLAVDTLVFLRVRLVLFYFPTPGLIIMTLHFLYMVNTLTFDICKEKKPQKTQY